MYEGHPGNTTKLTISQKVERQLKVVTEVMGLDAAGRKHWYYRLKREYQKEAAILKRLEQRQAKKDFRKMLKKYKIDPVLDQYENFDRAYNAKDDNFEEPGELPMGY